MEALEVEETEEVLPEPSEEAEKKGEAASEESQETEEPTSVG